MTSVPLPPGEAPGGRMVRFRSLGCYPSAPPSRPRPARSTDILTEMRDTRISERAGRLIDQDQDSSMEKKKREGYF